MAHPIVIDGLIKRFGQVVAVDALSLAVPQGSVYGFLGLNGAGKTTTIRILLDLLRPTAGRALIHGHDCRSASLKARADVGYLPGELYLYPEMTGRQLLLVMARLSGKSVAAAWQRDLLDRFNLIGRDLDRRTGEYSTGMKRKLGLVLAFQCQPSLLILDEPTEGLDPLMQEAFAELLTTTRREGRTVFMSSHVLSEVERVCDRIAILRAGRLVLEAPVESARRLAPRTVRATFRRDAEPPEFWPDGVEPLSITPLRWELRATGELGALVTLLGDQPLEDVSVDERRLEDVVIDYYRGQA
jgi:ABC-2 type transport system ATP-binding protein